ncbi:sigma-70 family RNA polymerase sigma factor [Acuticoccus sp. I52.16.1]|uniref:sigma-70 family RNA polymerase sigma factor n=1 Tax=Acuticoccus sp. I52.16.1 TaxID=2928472 RepID=UPI001FD36941|nr:sigma-70 family RNA polymerase sigma factor [Acuticoccus sp. I52.16.1]UOM34133.1 sigma-70 family RNA polymerase sigma factor [Acuticoccus sp. I52.16.1]
MDEASLEQLLGKTALGDRRAFEALYEKSNAKLFALCLRILQDKAEAEDAMQDAYVKIWRYAERYAASRASASTWMIAITRNQCIDRLRTKRAPGAALDAAENVADAAMRPDQKALAGDEAQRLIDCINGLGDADGRMVRIAYFGGVTYKALAERDGTPLGTVKSRMRRALAALKECLTR